MKDYSFDEVRVALDELQSRLGVRVPQRLHEKFSVGLYPNLLAYDKAKLPMLKLTALERCIIGATSSLNQPAHYYDIFGACRHVKVVQLLNHALEVHLSQKTKGLEGRVAKLKRDTHFDAFESTVFELLVGAKYLERPGVGGLEFVEQDPCRKTPDIRMRQHGRESFCECKKMDRSQDMALNIRMAAKACLEPVLAALRRRDISGVAEVIFFSEPGAIGSRTMVDACLSALETGTQIIEADFSVRASFLPKYVSPTYKLYPSPDFLFYRYDYRVRGEWMGILDEVIGSRVRHVSTNMVPKYGSSSWLNEITWDGAVKWRIGSRALLAKYRRFGFGTLFKGLEQIECLGRNSSVHLWLESDYYLGGREDALEDLRERITANGSDTFGWIVVNETLLDISPKGYFDLIEHAHFMRGPTASGRQPEVTNVFTTGSISTGSYGRGAELPDIDAK
jgi:hypothetical protein